MFVYLFSLPFYTDNVHLPHDHSPIPLEVQKNPKFFPLFQNTLGAIESTHINCSATATDQQAADDQKGIVTQNCLAICGFNMKFLYMFSSWDESASNATMFHDACFTDLPMLLGKYYLADAGFAICKILLIPYQGGALLPCRVGPYWYVILIQ